MHRADNLVTLVPIVMKSGGLHHMGEVVTTLHKVKCSVKVHCTFTLYSSPPPPKMYPIIYNLHNTIVKPPNLKTLPLNIYMNIVKQAPPKHNFYYNVVNNSLMATGFGHKTVFRLHTKNTASYCTRKCMPTFPSQSPVPVIKLN